MSYSGAQTAPVGTGMDNQPTGPPFKVYVAGVPKNFAAEDLQPYFDRVSFRLDSFAGMGPSNVRQMRKCLQCNAMALQQPAALLQPNDLVPESSAWLARSSAPSTRR